LTHVPMRTHLSIVMKIPVEDTRSSWRDTCLLGVDTT
jgi:hypothetical protein